MKRQSGQVLKAPPGREQVKSNRLESAEAFVQSQNTTVALWRLMMINEYNNYRCSHYRMVFVSENIFNGGLNASAVKSDVDV